MGHTCNMLLDIYASVGVPVESLHSEAEGLSGLSTTTIYSPSARKGTKQVLPTQQRAPALDKAKERHHRDVQVMIFTDCLVLLPILSKWGQSTFWPDPCCI